MGTAPPVDYKVVHRVEDALLNNVRMDCRSCGAAAILTGPGAAHAAAVLLRLLVDLNLIEEEALDAPFDPADELPVPFVPEDDEAEA